MLRVLSVYRNESIADTIQFHSNLETFQYLSEKSIWKDLSDLLIGNLNTIEWFPSILVYSFMQWFLDEFEWFATQMIRLLIGLFRLVSMPDKYSFGVGSY